MSRIRADYVFGATSAALTTTDTTFSSAALARLPAVASPDVAAVTLHDPATGVYETVYVTAHTASATTATITRAQEGSTAKAWASGASWLHGPTAKDIADLVAADATLSSAKADKTTYKGAWSAGTTYSANDTAENANALWQGVSPITGTAPNENTTTPQAGGALNGASGPLSRHATQQVTFTAGATYTKVRVLVRNDVVGGSIRVGVSASRAANPAATVFTSYADITLNGAAGADASVYTGTLSTPLTVAAGQTLWLTFIGYGAGPVDSGTVWTGATQVPGTTYIVSSSSAPSSSPWESWSDGWALSMVFQADPTPQWRKVADLPDTSGIATKADRAPYAGAWSATVPYSPNDTAEYGDALWRAVNPTYGTAPSDVAAGSGFVGGSGTISAALAGTSAEAMTFTAAGTYNKVRAGLSGNVGLAARIGFASAKPVSADKIAWLGYADVTVPASGWAEAKLSTPITVAAGQTIWAVVTGFAGASIRAEHANTAVGATLPGAATFWYAGSNSPTAPLDNSLDGYSMNMQLGVATVPWEKVADVPAVRTRATVTKTTASLADGAVESGTVNMAVGYRVMKVQTDRAARVRLYATAAQRDADASRAVGTDPTGDHGLLLEYVSTSGALSAVLSPAVDGASLEATPSVAIPVSITNSSGGASTVAVTFTYLRTE